MQGERARNHHYSLLDVDPKKGLVSLALPMIVAFLFQTGFNIVDTIFVGRLGAGAIAGVSLAFPFQMFIIALGSGLGIGAQSLVARSIGAGRKSDADKAAGHVFLIMIVSGALTTVVGLALASSLVSLLGAPEESGKLCLEYLRPILMGSFFIYHNIMLNSVFRGEGDTKRPMYFMATGAVLNVIFDPIFIFSFGLGVSGAAYATILSRMVVSSLSMYYIFVKRGTFVSLKRDSFRLDVGIIRKIFDVGFPSSLAQLAMSLSLFFLNNLVAPFGQNALAAFGIGFRVESVVFLPMMGLSGAFVSAVGYFKGSGQFDKIHMIHRHALKLLIIFMVLCSTTFFMSPKLIYSIFTTEQGVISIGSGYLRILSLFYPILPLSLLSAAGFQGIGKGYPSFILALVRSGCVSVPIAYYLTIVQGGPVYCVWIAIAMGDVFSAIIGHIWFKMEEGKLENP